MFCDREAAILPSVLGTLDILRASDHLVPQSPVWPGPAGGRPLGMLLSFWKGSVYLSSIRFGIVAG